MPQSVYAANLRHCTLPTSPTHTTKPLETSTLVFLPEIVLLGMQAWNLPTRSIPCHSFVAFPRPFHYENHSTAAYSLSADSGQSDSRGEVFVEIFKYQERELSFTCFVNGLGVFGSERGFGERLSTHSPVRDGAKATTPRETERREATIKRDDTVLSIRGDVGRIFGCLTVVG